VRALAVDGRHARQVAQPAVTAFQLWTVKTALAGYVPSLRSDLAVDPHAFGETGFIQPSALIGSFLPLSSSPDLMASGIRFVGSQKGHGGSTGGLHLPSGLRAAVSGAHPTVLVVASSSGRERRLRLWWLGFVGILLLISLPQSHLYLFCSECRSSTSSGRTFSSRSCRVWLLIMSGYGMDAFLTLGAEARRRMLSRALITVGAMTALAAAAVAWPLIEGDSRALAAKMTPYLIVDGVLLVAGGITLVWAARCWIPRGRPSCWCSSSVARRACTLSWRTGWSASANAA